MKKLLFLLFVVITLENCHHKINKIISPIDSKLWKEDSLACSGYRDYNYNRIIYGNENKLIGTSREEIEKCLGFPNRIRVYIDSSRVYYYFTEYGEQCDSSKVTDDDFGLYTRVIILSFNKRDKLIEIRGIVP